MTVVERRLHERKKLCFPYLVCKNDEFFAWRKTDTAARTANWYRLNITVHQKFSVPLSFHRCLTKVNPLPLNSEEYEQTIWLAIEGRHCMEPASWKNISYLIFNTHISFPAIVQSPFDNWHSPFSPTTIFAIGDQPSWWQWIKDTSVNCIHIK